MSVLHFLEMCAELVGEIVFEVHWIGKNECFIVLSRLISSFSLEEFQNIELLSNSNCFQYIAS